MTQERVVPAAVRAGIEMPNAPDAVLMFLTLSHPALATPIRLVSDVMDYVKDGVTWTGLPFGATPATDGEGFPYAELRVENVTRAIGQALERVNRRALATLELRSSADFDLSSDPRTEVVANAPFYRLANFELVSVTVDYEAGEAVGRLVLRDYAQEPWPGVRATQSRCPGLFR